MKGPVSFRSLVLSGHTEETKSTPNVCHSPNWFHPSGTKCSNISASASALGAEGAALAQPTSKAVSLEELGEGPSAVRLGLVALC